MKLGVEVGLGPGHTVLDGDPAPPRGTAPNFRPMSIMAKRSPISATAEHLYYRNMVRRSRYGRTLTALKLIRLILFTDRGAYVRDGDVIITAR